MWGFEDKTGGVPMPSPTVGKLQINRNPKAAKTKSQNNKRHE